MKRILELATVQGESNRETAVRWLPEHEKPTAKANVIAIYSDGETRLELHISDWTEAAAIPQRITVGE